MQEVLVDRCQLVLEDGVEVVDYPLVAFHGFDSSGYSTTVM
jgi:hypothetical protein